ncbi:MULTISPECIES: helix-turn-helix domain-containing protein [Streptosporangium]|uniref:Tetratricopeptide (TPR) repeat protein n=1 Tax=Streptosporangium brasiliense TaxID=47480 RepID=A0ABT9RE84_9ACTN|nr:helix-turn-helix transcriptional regulator [Streptosporangium brasiliense]MDP9867583.1 tetratricopeptide (TPR) repeat protein [Streptosporangium brasiliense]
MSGTDVGGRLQALRKQRGMTIAQVAEPGLREEDVAAIEGGMRDASAPEIRALADRLGCSAAELGHGITDRYVTALHTRVAQAEAALRQGEIETAGEELARLIAEPALRYLPDTRRRVGYGYALALEAADNRPAAIEQLTVMLQEACSDHAETTAALAGLEAQLREQRISIALALCRCHREVGELQAAVRVGEEALERETLSGWTDRLVELASTLLAAYVERGDRERMAHFSTELLDEADRIGSPRAIVAASWNSAVVARILGDPLEADMLSNRALRVQGELDDGLAMGRLRMCMAQYDLRHGPQDVERVGRMLTDAHAELVAAAAHPSDVISCLLALARLDLLREEPQAALERALATVEQAAGMVGPVAVEAHELLAEVYRALGRLEEAALAQTAAAQALERMTALWRASAAWMVVADLHGDAGEVDQGRAALEQALMCAAL